MLRIEVTITDKNGKLYLRTHYERHQSQEHYRYFEPSGWTIDILPPSPDHSEKNPQLK